MEKKRKKLTKAGILRLLSLTAKYDDTLGLSWTEDHHFYIICNDTLLWGCSDAEDVACSADLDLLEQCYKDIGGIWGGTLYACRKAGMRPQGAAYPKEAELWPLFDACGPEREVDIGNPMDHPSKKQ